MSCKMGKKSRRRIGHVSLIDQLEPRILMTSVNGATDVPLGPVKAGDTIYLNATLTTSDPNENGEGEPLVLTSSGGWNTTISSYDVAHPLSFTATKDNETLSVSITGQDGDESASVDIVDVAHVKARLYTQPEKDYFRAQGDEYAKAAEAAGVMALGGVGASLGGVDVPADVWTAYWTAVGIYDADMARKYNNMVNDPPDANYTQVAQPTFPVAAHVTPGGAITQGVADSLNAVTNLDAAEIGFLQAINTAVNRESTAAAAGDTASVGLQVRALNQFHASLDSLLGTESVIRNDAYTTLANLVGASRLTFTSSQVRRLEDQFASSGLPASFQSVLNTVDGDPGASDFVRDILIVQDTRQVASGPTMVLARPGLLTALNNAANAVSGRPAEQSVVDDLRSLQTSATSKSDIRALGQVLGAISPALDTEMWTDDFHLSNSGARFFTANNSAIQKLIKIAHDKRSSLTSSQLIGDADKLARAAEVASANALPLAATSQRKASIFAAATASFTAGFNALNAGSYKTALSAFGKAWKDGAKS